MQNCSIVDENICRFYIPPKFRLFVDSSVVLQNIQFFTRSETYVHIFQQAIGNIIYPSMYVDLIPACPGILDDGGVADVDDLLASDPKIFRSLLRDKIGEEIRV